jgi:cell wall-associated NlpC family hydrolase
MMRPTLGPPMPAEWTPEINAAALDHARELYPKEAAGIVEDGRYVRLENRAGDKAADEIHLSDDDMLRVAGAQVFFHSHPDGIGAPSAADMIYQEQLGIPFVIAVLPAVDVFAFGDQLGRAPLLGRGFRHGVHDCYAVIRDWYEERGVHLPNGMRDWEWWSKGQNLYIENFERAGFYVIEPSAATRPGDVLLFTFHYKVPMHGAVVHEGHLFLHHPSGSKPVDATRISCLTPRLRYEQHISLALRHRDYAP